MSSETTNNVEIVTGTSKDNRKSEVFEVRLAGSTRLLSVTDSSKCEHHLFVDYYITSNRQLLFTRCNCTFPGRWCNPLCLIYILEHPSGLVVPRTQSQKNCLVNPIYHVRRNVSLNCLELLVLLSLLDFSQIRHHLWLYRCLFCRPTTPPPLHYHRQIPINAIDDPSLHSI